MFESKYSKVLTIVLIVIIVAIVILLGLLGFDYVQKYFVTKQASEFVNDYEGEITTGNNTENKNEDTNSSIENISTDIFDQTPTSQTNSSTSGGTKSKWNGFTVLGTMKIPTINFEYPILEEVSTSAISKAVSLLWPNGENLNQPGNVVIIGHNYRNGTFFSRNKELKNGDVIYSSQYNVILDKKNGLNEVEMSYYAGTDGVDVPEYNIYGK